MKLNALHHIAVISSDYRKAREFYVDKLGFEVIRENRREQQNDWKLDLRLGGMELELFCKPDAPKRPSYPEACGLRHIAFKVDSVETAVKLLAEKGIVCEPIRTDAFTNKAMTFFSDPDGLPLELHE